MSNCTNTTSWTLIVCLEEITTSNKYNLSHYELWKIKVHFQFFTLSLQKHVYPGSFLHQTTLVLNHKPKCIPNRLQTIGVALESLDRFIKLNPGVVQLTTGSAYSVIPYIRRKRVEFQFSFPFSQSKLSHAPFSKGDPLLIYISTKLLSSRCHFLRHFFQKIFSSVFTNMANLSSITRSLTLFLMPHRCFHGDFDAMHTTVRMVAQKLFIV